MKHFIFVIFLTTSIFAQSGNTQITGEEYSKIFAALSAKKESLQAEKEALKKAVGELTKEHVKLSDPKLRREICRDYFIKKYGKKIGLRILDGKVWKGMTEEMLRDSYGKPDKIDTNKQKWGVFSQWYYGKQIFFFKNGKLFEWEQ